MRLRTPGGREAIAHLALYTRQHTRLRVVELDPPRPLLEWCLEHGVQEALNGGFFAKPQFEPLGDLYRAGKRRPTRPFRAPWHRVRGAIHIDDDAIAIAARHDLPAKPTGDLLQAGPLLVHDRRATVHDNEDPEGFSTTADEFDSDITDGPLPRTAIALTATAIVALAVDGRSNQSDGLTLAELATFLVELGATAAMNFDGGSSSALITAGAMRNTPRDDEGQPLPDGYPTPTAVVFDARRHQRSPAARPAGPLPSFTPARHRWADRA